MLEVWFGLEVGSWYKSGKKYATKEWTMSSVTNFCMKVLEVWFSFWIEVWRCLLEVCEDGSVYALVKDS